MEFFVYPPKSIRRGRSGGAKLPAPFACEIFPLPRTFWHHRLMAWRIQDSVIRGEMDNRLKGRVRGKLWLHGHDEPVELDLAGNACPDLAGCLLTFKNPAKTFPMRKK